MSTELEAKLEQAKKDRVAVNITLNAEIAALEREIADSEVTYSIGDRFCHVDGGQKYLLSSDGHEKCQLTCLADGEIWSAPVYCDEIKCITKDEFNKIRHNIGFARYWDARKKKKC